MLRRKKIICNIRREQGSGAGSPDSKRIYFAYVKKHDEEYTLLTHSYFCRDLLTSWWYYNKPKDKVTRLFIHFVTQKDSNIFLKNIKYLHEFEKASSLPITKVIKYDDKGIIVEGSHWWNTACWKISLYTFLLKRLAYTNAQPWKKATLEVNYLKLIEDNLSFLTSNMKNRKEMNDKNTSRATSMKLRWFFYPTSSGFASVLSNQNHPQRKVMVEYQKKQEIRLLKQKTNPIKTRK